MYWWSLAYSIIKNKDSSKIYQGGYITYSNELKIKNLNVKMTTIKKYGAVSEETAKEMLRGLFMKTKTNICISTTGIAGPGGGNKKKPVGLVFVGIKFHDKTYVFQKNYKGSRLEIQRKTKEFVFKKINQLI